MKHLLAPCLLSFLISTLPAAGQEPHVESLVSACGASPDELHGRTASGTAWLPDATPMHGQSWCAGTWELMVHGSVFGQFLEERGQRGSEQFGSFNWVMTSAGRPLAGGRVRARGMFSLEPWTIGGCGYPDLLASGELCADEPIHDQQHPHDLLMEVAASFDRPLNEALTLQVYGGVAGEPALGPVSYPHRASAMPNPIAPITHHWLDATHTTFGVVTAAVYGRTWKAEASLFNGREPDEDRADLDLGALDSWSGRISWLPLRSVAIQVSAGHLEEAEAQPLHEGGARFDVDRVTASATYHRLSGMDRLWATTVAWGRNAEVVGRTHALLMESTLASSDRDHWFGRYEIGSKPAYDLGIIVPGACSKAHCPPDPAADGRRAVSSVPDADPVRAIYTVSKVQVGYVRHLQSWRALTAGVGTTASLSLVPASLEPYYGNRTTVGWGLFITIRASRHVVTGAHGGHSGVGPQL